MSQLFRYMWLLLHKKDAMPVYLTQFVTNRCNAKCKHCFVSKEEIDISKELTLNEIADISKHLGSNLYSVLLTGGEPFLREDLRHIIELYIKNSNAQVIIIATNGFFTSRIIKTMKEVLPISDQKRILITFSLDGLPDVHDTIRGVKGMFAKAVESYCALKNLQRKYDNLHVSINVTISSFNQDDLLPLYKSLTEKWKVDNITTTLTRGNPTSSLATGVDMDKYKIFNDMIKTDIRLGRLKGYENFWTSDLVNAQNIITRDRIAETMRHGKYISPCFAGTLTGVVYSDGTVPLCELRESIMGNLRDCDYRLDKIWFSANADQLRISIKSNKCFCTHECFSICNVLFNVRYLPAIMKETIRLKLSRVINHAARTA